MNTAKWNRIFCITILFTAVMAITGCMVGPKYRRPSVDVPGGYRGTAPEVVSSDQTQHLPVAA